MTDDGSKRARWGDGNEGEAAVLADWDADFPVGVYVAAALADANISCDSGEDVDRFLAELERRGYVVTRR